MKSYRVSCPTKGIIINWSIVANDPSGGRNMLDFFFWSNWRKLYRWKPVIKSISYPRGVWWTLMNNFNNYSRMHSNKHLTLKANLTLNEHEIIIVRAVEKYISFVINLIFIIITSKVVSYFELFSAYNWPFRFPEKNVHCDVNGSNFLVAKTIA